MVQVANILLISLATSERAFFALRRINTYLRTTIDQDRFSNLFTLSIGKDVEIDSEIISEIFTTINKRKMNLK